MGLGGAALKLIATIFYGLEFCCAAIVLGIYSWFLADLAEHHITISNDWRAVEGIAGSAVLFTVFAILLTCFLGGHRIFAFLAIFLDIAFVGAFIAVVWLTRHGAGGCSGYVHTPLGNGPSNTNSPGYGVDGFGFGPNIDPSFSPNLHTACRLNTAAFAVALIAIFLFLISAILQFFLSRHHIKEKKYGPSPANNYTSGSGRGRFWKRKPKTTRDAYGDEEIVQTNGAGPGTITTGTATDIRPSHDTGYTGTTVGNNATATHAPLAEQKIGGYHTAPTGTAVNPYGYDNQRTTATNF